MVYVYSKTAASEEALSKNMDDKSQPDCQQPGGSAKSSVKKSGEDLTRNETEQKPANLPTPASEKENIVDDTKAGMNKEPEASKGTDSDAGEDLKNKPQLKTKAGDCGPDGDQKPSEATPTDEKTTMTSSDNVTPGDGGENLTRNETEQKPATLPTPASEKENIVDDTKAGMNKEPEASKGTDSDAGEEEKKEAPPQKQSNKQSVLRTSTMSQKEPPNEEIEKQTKKMREKEKQDVETMGPTITQAESTAETGVLGGGVKLLMAVAIVALVAILAQYLLHSKSPPQKTDLRQVDVFLKQMEKVKARFPNQRAELWSRSEIHLKRHLQTSQPAEPVSLILTSGLRAERTMRCLAQDLASAFSSALNASVLHIDGAGKASQDSDQVKLDIDRKLQGAFEGDKPVAVIHRLEELPPGSTLIFYRYCDHENAAYKKTFLIFTVLLADEEEIPAKLRLSIVEEMVDDHLQKKFLSHNHPVSFDRMDLNKYGGLWSRISHLILPVAAEERMEHEGC
ncbi:torsin-1A-interacting protein 2-like isoform 5-T6 [Anableps anableps]